MNARLNGNIVCILIYSVGDDTHPTPPPSTHGSDGSVTHSMLVFLGEMYTLSVERCACAKCNRNEFGSFICMQMFAYTFARSN